MRELKGKEWMRKRKLSSRRPTKQNPDRARFIAWDGEGYTVSGRHHYGLLQSSDGAMHIAPENTSLSREEVFEAFLDSKRQYPDAINFIFGGNYDFNMILRSNGLPRWYANRLYKGYRLYLDNGYRVKVVDGKMLTITGLDGTTVTVYDVFPFFQRSFVSACDEYLGKDYPGRDFIQEMKAQRNEFTYADMDEIVRYNSAELDVMVLLMDELRRRLDAADIPIGQWYGPGSIASRLMRRYSIKKSMVNSYADLPEVSRAAQFAYAGGRFEIIKCGHVERPAYEYDINSAYPAAMLNLPDLTKGKWTYYDGDPGNVPFALYHLQSTGPSDSDSSKNPHPLWTRISQGVFYSHAGAEGWYWTPDVECLRDSGHSYIVLGTWVYEPTTTDKPFAFVQELFEKRLALKKAGNGAHVGIKLGLNSLYGKMAQQVGFSADENGVKIPPYHQLEWAGYVTSHCRMQLWQAIKSNLDDVIAMETDAVFSRVPLPVNVGTGLGEWEETVFSSLTYCNSGIYWATTADGKEIQKSRGFHPRYISREQAIEALSQGEESLSVPTTQFITLGNALNTNYWRWGRWVNSKRDVFLVPSQPGQKRTHVIGCDACEPAEYSRNGTLKVAPRFTVGEWHDTVCEYGDIFGRIPSTKFAVEWVDGYKGDSDEALEEEEW